MCDCVSIETQENSSINTNIYINLRVQEERCSLRMMSEWLQMCSHYELDSFHQAQFASGEISQMIHSLKRGGT